MGPVLAVVGLAWLAALALFLCGAVAFQRVYEDDVVRGAIERELMKLRSEFLERQRVIGEALLPVMTAMAAQFQLVIDAFNRTMTTAVSATQDLLDRLRQEGPR
ncbi:MAG: hypothetical protein SHS37scaffold145_19 [Phage 71_18]|nr:MAG: hypothetical protein SHS37scaffold145_19 [Phage 71_18]